MLNFLRLAVISRCNKIIIMKKITIQTERLILRPWQEQDVEAFAKMNADPCVMEHFPSVKTFKESAEEAQRIMDHFEKYGWGFWAAVLKNENKFIGFIGLYTAAFPAHFTPTVEIGWRLAQDYWGNGYATEGALASLDFGFSELNLNEIVAYTPTANKRSRRVMERIGMHYDPKDDFDHPNHPEGHHQRRKVLYRIKASDWD